MEDVSPEWEERIRALREELADIQSNISSHLTTKKLEIVDEKDKTRGWMTTDETGDAEIVLLDGQGKRRIRVFCSEDGYVGMHLFGTEAESIVRLEIKESKIPSLFLTTPNRKTEICAEIDLEANAEIRITDNETGGKVSLILEEGKTPCVSVKDDNNNIIFKIPE